MKIPTFTLFYTLTQALKSRYEGEVNAIYNQLLMAASLTEEALNQVADQLSPVFLSYFNQCAQAGNVLVDRRISSLTNALSVPFKYDRNVIDRVNGVSVFKGYYSDRYRNDFTNGEIDRLKRTILRGTYENIDEQELSRRIQETINVSDRRARLLARNETQRLRESTSAIYASQPEVREKYDRMWDTQGDANVRPSHQEMQGLLANEDGYFISPTYGEVAGPGAGPVEFVAGCRCRSIFVHK